MTHPNNERLRTLLDASGLKRITAYSLFNHELKPSMRPDPSYALYDTFNSWLAHPEAKHWQPMPSDYLEHAEQVLGQLASNAQSRMSVPDFLAPFSQELESFRREYIHIEPTEVDPSNNHDDYHIERAVLDVHVSKFLGKPYWPKAMDYPRRARDGRPMILVAQINFSEVPPLEDFPRSGVLQLFVCAGDDDFLDWGRKKGNHRIIFHEKIDEDCLLDFSFLTPHLFQDSPVVTEAALAFYKRVEYGGVNDFNFTFSACCDNTGDDEPELQEFLDHLLGTGIDPELYEEFLEQFSPEQQTLIQQELLGGRGEKIGGYADFTQRDPRECEQDRFGLGVATQHDDVLVLQIDGFREAFHAGTGHIFIAPQALRDRDFSKAYLHHDNT